MAQQANPKVAGQNDALRMYPNRFSIVVSKTPLGSCSSTPMMLSLLSIPVEAAAPQDVHVGDEDGDDEQHHLHQSEQAQLIERHGPRVEEDDLDVEDDEQHR